MSPEKLLVANRGEIACRIIRAAKLLGLRTVAVYSDVDAELPHVSLADEAYLIGPARPAQSYLDHAKLIEIAKRSGARFVHPGYGFLAESASFAEDCAGSDLVFVGPDADVIAEMGDKDHARRTAERAGVPVLPGTGKLSQHDDKIIAQAMDIGFPLLVKASAGGGGIGMRLVETPEDLSVAIDSTRLLAQKAFGDDSVFLERYLNQPRHIEIQVFGFGDGRAVHMFERDCSLQRRHQKVIEEARAPGLPDGLAQKMAEAAVKLCGVVRYSGAGTVEFLVDTCTYEFFFLEMNTRIQVEHPVTEMITGIDLVAAQLRLAAGDASLYETLSQSITPRGHAVEARIYAENPAKNFFPSPGKLSAFRFEASTGLRIEYGYQEGNTVTPFYDPMLMKMIACGHDRNEAIERLDAGLEALCIEGVAHNAAYLRACLRDTEFVAGAVHTGLLAQRHTQLLAAASQIQGVS